MLESGDRGFCDFRFTVGLDRVVRGTLSRNEFAGQRDIGQMHSPHEAIVAYSSKRDARARIAQSEVLGSLEALTPRPDADESSESLQPQSDQKANNSNPRSPGITATESKETAPEQTKKKGDKRSHKSKKQRESKSKRKIKRTPNNARSMPVLFPMAPVRDTE
ncbi:hypothetical protein MRX96_033300 [Rhipicephalus microplus]